jgi:hypothetical protein
MENAEQRQPVREIRRPVERVDDPSAARLRHGGRAAGPFFAQDGMIRKTRGYQARNSRSARRQAAVTRSIGPFF